MHSFRRLFSQSSENKENNFTKTLGIIFFSGISLGAAGLGFWQIERYNQKVEKISLVQSKMKEDEKLLSPKLSQKDFIEFVKNHQLEKVNFGLCEFDYSKEIKLGLRPMPIKPGRGAQGMGTNPLGYFILTPCKRISDGNVFFVKRGWIPSTCQEWPKQKNPILLKGISSQCEKRGQFSPVNDLTKNNILLWLEEEELKKLLNTTENIPIVELINDENENDNKNNGNNSGNNSNGNSFVLRDVETLFEENIMPITHAVYSLTWFSLSVAGFIMTYYKFKNPRKIVKAFKK